MVKKVNLTSNKKGFLNSGGLMKLGLIVLVILFLYSIIIDRSESNEPIIKSNELVENSVTDVETIDASTVNTVPVATTNPVVNIQSQEKNVGMVSCGNGVCEPELGEDYKNCGECPEYVVDDYHQIKSCGNGVCEPDLFEVVQNCPADCQ